MRLLKLTQKYAAAITLVLATGILAAIAGAGGGETINAAFGYVVAGLEAVLYFKIPLPFLREMPLVVAVLFFGAIFFTVRFRFINFRAFKHGIDVLLGRYDDPEDPGDVSHFQALSSALSATVGLGNIAGVAVAVSMGGPGAVFWMMVVALFGMSSKFAECTLGQIYRQKDTAGEMRGGPMVYLREGLKDRTLGPIPLDGLGYALSVLFAILCIGTAIGAGNMFQTNQSFKALGARLTWLGGEPATGEVTLEADRPVTLDAPSHQLHFVAPPRETSGEDPLRFSPLEEASASPSDWTTEDETSSVTWTFRGNERGVTGILELESSSDGIAVDDLGAFLEHVRPSEGESPVPLDGMAVDESDWSKVETVETERTKWAKAMDFDPDVRAWDEAQRWKLTLEVPHDGDADVSLVVRTDQRRSIENLRTAINGVAPPLSNLSAADLLAFKPAEERLTLDEEDWSRGDSGEFRTTIPVESASTGSEYNVRSGAISGVLDARLGSKKREIRDWLYVPDLRTDNGKATAGGTGSKGWLYGIVLLVVVGLVIIGGIKSIARVAEKVVPAMCAFYIIAGIVVIATNFEHFGLAISTIFSEAFRLEAGWGVFVGIFVNGVRRAAFSSEAGIGSAPIAHSAAKTDEPVREGVVAMLGPFIDTIVVCFITGMVIVISGKWATPSTAGLGDVTLTVAAFETASPIFAWALSIAVVLFAFSTMLSWSYYGERCWTYLFGDDQAMPFRFIFLFFILLGSVSTLDNVLSFGDYFLLAMALPNILGVVLLSDEIDEQLRDYWSRYVEGEMEED